MKRHVALASFLLAAGLAMSSTASFAAHAQPAPHAYPPGPSGMNHAPSSTTARKINPQAPASSRDQQLPNSRLYYPPGPSAHEQPRPTDGSAG